MLPHNSRSLIVETEPGLESIGTSKLRGRALIACNIILMAIAIAAAIFSAQYFRSTQIEAKQSDFTTTVESMKSVTQTYLDSEQGYVNDWAHYISNNNMTLNQAAIFLDGIDTSTNRYVHIVDMDTYDAWSLGLDESPKAIDTYKAYQDESNETGSYMREAMHAAFADEHDGTIIIGNYKIEETRSSAVSVGKNVTLETTSGPKDYLLLRVIPVDSLKSSWVFPTEYQSAEVGIITTNGDYVVQSPSMKSSNFPDYIRAYNFQDNYNEVNALRNELKQTESGVLHYQDFRGDDRLWYYTSLGNGSNLDVIGSVKESEFTPKGGTWHNAFLIGGTLILLAIIDGLHLRKINIRLRKTAQAADEANQAKTRFLAAMSHDIRTPMNAVLGMTSLAKKNANDTGYVAQCLDKAQSAGKQLLTLINDVLDISKIESGQFTLVTSDISLKQIAADLEEIISPQTTQRELALTFETGPLPHPYVHADEMRLNQIYLNLLSNAVKYTKPGGSIAVSLFEEPASDANKNTTLITFTVSDTGIGMSEEFQKEMYHSFSRAISTQVNRIHGTGLGLSIVSQLVELMHGTIECESAEGVGTTFTVRLELPIAASSAQPALEGEEASADFAGMRILVAEDNDLNWEVINAQLAELGAESERAFNGIECVDLIREAKPGSFDAIFMDIQMPQMGGLEATRNIRALPAEQNGAIPIVAMTADAFAEDVQACLKCGMNGHIAKPVDVTKLQEYLYKIKKSTL